MWGGRMWLPCPQFSTGSKAPRASWSSASTTSTVGSRCKGSDVRRLSVPGVPDGPQEDAFGVYLTAQVLRCSCGFQMEVLD